MMPSESSSSVFYESSDNSLMALVVPSKKREMNQWRTNGHNSNDDYDNVHDNLTSRRNAKLKLQQQRVNNSKGTISSTRVASLMTSSRRAAKTRTSTTVLLFTIGVILISSLLIMDNVVVNVNCQEQLPVESRQQKDNEDLNDAIKYLEKLDKYFSQMARPRFGRSQLKQPMLRSFGDRGFNSPASDSLQQQQQQQQQPLQTLMTNRITLPTRYGNALDSVAARLAEQYRNGLNY